MGDLKKSVGTHPTLVQYDFTGSHITDRMEQIPEMNELPSKMLTFDLCQ